MPRGKPVQEGVRVKLLAGMTWQTLAAMSREEIREKNLLPKGFYPLPHPNHPEGICPTTSYPSFRPPFT